MIPTSDLLGQIRGTDQASSFEASSVPSFKSTVADLSTLTSTLYRTFEYATHRTRDFFENENVDRDPYLLPSLVRFYVKQFLGKEGIVASEADFELENLANNGLSLLQAPYHVRILKSDKGSVPTPGYSLRKQNFYNQQASMYATADGDLVQTSLNVIFLWELDPKNNLARLLLACPKAGGETRDSVELHWCEPVPHPATTITVKEASGEPTEDLEMGLKSQHESTGRE